MPEHVLNKFVGLNRYLTLSVRGSPSANCSLAGQWLSSLLFPPHTHIHVVPEKKKEVKTSFEEDDIQAKMPLLKSSFVLNYENRTVELLVEALAVGGTFQAISVLGRSPRDVLGMSACFVCVPECVQLPITEIKIERCG